MQSEGLPIEERFVSLFMKNGGKFLYCMDINELREMFESILEENDWFEKEVWCTDDKLHFVLDENKLNYKDVTLPKFYFMSCESLIAEAGSILFSSKQIGQNTPHELPMNMIVFAQTSQLVNTKNDGLEAIRKKYDKDFPTNIIDLKYFNVKRENQEVQYSKNLYLLLLEDF